MAVFASTQLGHWQAIAETILARSDALASSVEADLLHAARALRWRARAGTPIKALAVETYALVVEAARRTLAMRHFPVQVMAGLALAEGRVAEMQTGEGKTLTATLPVVLRALSGDGAHVVTANDYLAGRDAGQMGPVYRFLGLSVGCVQAGMDAAARRDAYACDVTYGTAKEFGFDFLRDRLRLEGVPTIERQRPCDTSDPAGEAPVQRGHAFALVDEADSILIDDARTPLIISVTEPNDEAVVALYRWSRSAAAKLTADRDFVYEPQTRSAYLTDEGCRRVILLRKPALLDVLGVDRLYAGVEQALTAELGFHRDRDYVVSKEGVQIVDESTGRVLAGRKWQDGLHQAVEAKERLSITAATGQAARITVQSYFRRYAHLAGMTGTALPARREFRSAYGLRTVAIPTHRPCLRVGLPTRVFATLEAKRTAVLREIARLHAIGRAVLVGTPSVGASEALATRLAADGIPHQVLNAHHHAREAAIVARAGEPGRVTVATNMAGRGTDIVLAPEVRQAGGLHVIATEMHSAARIDRQLVGRCARQGDPGSYQFFLSLEDELLRCLDPAKRDRLQRRSTPNPEGELPRRWISVFRRAQRRLERLYARQRRDLLRQEHERLTSYRAMGLDPHLELAD